jgi:hypothetical protein
MKVKITLEKDFREYAKGKGYIIGSAHHVI